MSKRNGSIAKPAANISLPQLPAPPAPAPTPAPADPPAGSRPVDSPANLRLSPAHAPDSLLSDYLSSRMSLVEIAQIHKVSLSQLRDWATSPQVQTEIAAFTELTALRDPVLLVQSRAPALGALEHLSASLGGTGSAGPIVNSPSLKSADLTRAHETARKSANELLRLLRNPEQNTPPPRGGAGGRAGPSPADSPPTSNRTDADFEISNLKFSLPFVPLLANIPPLCTLGFPPPLHNNGHRNGAPKSEIGRFAASAGSAHSCDSP